VVEVTCPNELVATLTIEDAGKFRITRPGVGVAERNEPAGRFRLDYWVLDRGISYWYTPEGGWDYYDD
jgi:hypothetical protein